MTKYIAETNMYFIAHNEETIHHGELQEGMQVATAMSHLEKFFDEQEWKNRLQELGYDMSKLKDSEHE